MSVLLNGVAEAVLAVDVAIDALERVLPLASQHAAAAERRLLDLELTRTRLVELRERARADVGDETTHPRAALVTGVATFDAPAGAGDRQEAYRG